MGMNGNVMGISYHIYIYKYDMGKYGMAWHGMSWEANLKRESKEIGLSLPTTLSPHLLKIW